MSGLTVSEDDIDILLLKGGLNPDAEVDVRQADTAIYTRISVLLKSMMQNISEGGYSVSWNMEAVKLFYTSLCTELGVENVLETAAKPKIRNRSNYW